MNITIEQCEHKEIKQVRDVLYLDGKQYKNNDILLGFIYDFFVEGRLHINESNSYFLQHVKEGSRPSFGAMLNFNKSWEFSVQNSQTFTSNVKLFNYKKEPDFNIKELELKYPIPNFIIDGYGNFMKKSKNQIFFKLKNVQHCCGATILSDFKENNSNIYNLSNEEIKEVDSFLKNNMTSNKIAYLLKNEESEAITFLTEKLNFKVIDEFINKNTFNNIKILSRNDAL